MNVPCVANPLKKCTDNSEPNCCMEKGAKFGVILEEGCKCDTRLGLPTKDSRDKIRKSVPEIITEKFSILTKENYGSDSDWEQAFFVLLVIFILTVGVIIIHGNCTNKYLP